MTKAANRTAGSGHDHAVVIGASMGGLTAAAALAPHYARVTVLDRDELPDGPDHRRGVPQSKHAHGLHPGGLQALEQLLPGLRNRLSAVGAPTGDVGRATTFNVGGSRLSIGDAGVDGVGITRPVLEHIVRSMVAELPGIEIRDRTRATGLVTPDTAHVTGVVVETGDGGAPEPISADLVVDASGKVSSLPTWLAELGYEPPAEDRVACRMAYLSRRWQLANTDRDGVIINVVTPAATPQFGVMIALEDGTHIVTLGGLLDSAPAKDDAAFLEFAASLPDPVISDALVGATPVTELQPSHFPASVRRRYDQMRSFPSGLLAIADAIASFNPMYGQGMSVASLEAVALRDMLASGRLDAKKFFKSAYKIADVAWQISTGGDLRYPEVEGKRTRVGTFMNKYLDRLTAAATTDPVLGRQFLLVAGFIEPPQSFFKPGIVRRVLRGPKPTVPAASAPAPLHRAGI